MATFLGDFHEVFTSTADANHARKTFGDLDTIITHYGALEHGEKLDENTVRFTLKEQNQGVTSFQGRYTCRYLLDDANTLTWDTIGEDGNIKADGTAIFTPTANGCSIDYHGRLALDMPINRMMAKVLKPVIQTVIAQEMRAYVKRMISAAEA